MSKTLTDYLTSPLYLQDMQATQTIWTQPGMVGRAGMFLFLSYITIPLLIHVQPAHRMARSATLQPGLLREQEKRFLQRMLGISEQEQWAGGIANPRIRRLISDLRRRHLRFSGMHQSYITFFAELIALAPARISTRTSPADLTRTGYWRYMTHACTLLGVCLHSEEVTARHCQDFIDRHTRPTDEGQKMFAILAARYPTYIQQVVPDLFPATRLAAQRLQEECKHHD
jgi:hypothetical protein